MAEKNTGGNASHSMCAVARRGSDALPAHLRPRELELVENLGTHEGVLRELENAAHLQGLIVACGADYLERINGTIAARGDTGNYWQTKHGMAALKALGSYINGYVRTLDKLAALRGDADAIDMAAIMAKRADNG